MSFGYNLNFISLVIEDDSAGELMPKMCLSYCSMVAENQWDLSLWNKFWKQNYSYLALNLSERRECGWEVWAGHRVAALCSWASCYFSHPRCRKGGCSCLWGAIKSLSPALMEALWDSQRHVQKECSLLTSVFCHAENSASLLDFKHFQLMMLVET